MIYKNYTVGGILMHADRSNHKYIQKVRTKSGKWRYIYKDVSNRLAANRQANLFNKHKFMYDDSVNALSGYDNARKIVDQQKAMYKDMNFFDMPQFYKFADKVLETEKKYFTNRMNTAEKLANKNAEKYYEHMDRARKTESNWKRQEMEDRRSKSDTAKTQKGMTIRDEIFKIKKKKK